MNKKNKIHFVQSNSGETAVGFNKKTIKKMSVLNLNFLDEPLDEWWGHPKDNFLGRNPEFYGCDLRENFRYKKTK